MTQLFDTAGYDSTDTATDPTGPESRHLRSVSGGPSTAPINWRLDDQTIEIGRRGIAKAREALRQSRATSSISERRAA